MPAVLLPNGKQQFFTTPGVPAVGYKLWTWAAGTSTPQTTWADALKVSANPNPIILDARGEAVIFWDGVYKIQLQDSTGAPVWPPVDNISSQSSVFGLTLLPSTTSVTDIGSITFKWRDAYFSGTGKFDTNVTINGVSAYNSASGNIGSIARTEAEIAAGVVPTDLSFSAQPYDIRRYGARADSTGVFDSTAALNMALLVATQTVQGQLGSAISVPAGQFNLSSMVPLPNRVRVLGVNKRGSYFKAMAGWAVGNGVTAYNAGTTYGVTTGTALILVTSAGILYSSRQAGNVGNTPASSPAFWTPISNAMFYAQNGYTNSPVAGTGVSMFDSTLENVTVDANNITGLGCVLSSAWQEDCGLRGALTINHLTYGVRYQDAFGGASLSKLIDCEIFGAGGLGVDLTSPMGSVAGFMLDVSNTSITGGASNLTAGISCIGNSVLCRSVHFEVVNIGVLIDGPGFHSLDDLTGAPTVTTLVQDASTFTGTLVMKNCRRNGATNFLNDLRAGGYGAITGVSHPLFIIDATSTTESAKGLAFASAWCAFDGTVAGTNAPAAGYNVTSVTRNSVGNYTVTMLRPMLSANAASFGSCNLTTSGINVATNLSTTQTFKVLVTVAGVATDSNEVKGLIFGG